MSPQPYRIHAAAVVSERLRQLLDQLAASGQESEAREAAQTILHGLTWLAEEFGESRFPVGRLGELRFARVGPLSVWFAVHQERREVHISRFGLAGPRRR
jgi:hypothetical protein